MIVSHSHAFIFIHCRKVAGSSMKVALAPYLSGDDIVIGSLNEIIDDKGPIPPAIRKIMRRPDIYALSRAARLLGKSGSEAHNIAVKRYFERFLGSNPPHPTATKAAEFLGDAWERYRKFCFVRNPYTQTASDYHWRKRATGLDFSFTEFLAALRDRDDSSGMVHPGAILNWDMIAIDDVLQADFVGRYERLHEDFSEITQKLSLPHLSLDKAMKVKSGGKDYGNLYGTAEKAAVTELFAAEIECFGYDFPY